MVEDVSSSNRYFQRLLRVVYLDGSASVFTEDEFFALSGPKVVLGEPGMGKTELVEQASRRLEIEAISAVRFMNSKRPEQFVQRDRLLLIDGLDEAMARKDGDAVDKVLEQLDTIGLPDFLLTCRAREWQARSQSALNKLYKANVHVATLEPLSREEASEFLVTRFPSVDAEYVLSHIERHGIADLYANPLMLRLMGQVAVVSDQLPATRADLLAEVCSLLWPEHDMERQEVSRLRLAEDEALSSAGAIMASLIFAGAETVSIAAMNQLDDGEVSLAEIERLPGAEKASLLLASKLFVSQGPGLAKPIHRLIAEYLGARWVAGLATTGRRRRRLLSSIWESGGIPASLRGLHAWLAYHSSPLALDIIRADPFGVLRYGETSHLTTSQVEVLFDSLLLLAEADPYFRVQDWSSRSAVGLLVPALEDRIRAVIGTMHSNFHFRSLLLEGLNGNELAFNLTGMLKEIVLSTERFYRERKAAADALMPFADPIWWQHAITELRNQGTEDSTRLAHELIDAVACDVDDELLVSTILAELGLIICSLPRTRDNRPHMVRHYGGIVSKLAAQRIPTLLDCLVDSVAYLKDVDPMAKRDIAGFGASLIVRSIDEGLVFPNDAPRVWAWLGLIRGAQYFQNGERRELQACLDQANELRRAIQEHAVYDAPSDRPVWLRRTELDLREALIGLSFRPDDVTWFLQRLETADNKNPLMRKVWIDLMQIGFDGSGFKPQLVEASRLFQQGDAQLEAAIGRIVKPPKPGWQRRQEKIQKKRERDDRVAKEWRRRDFIQHREALRSGAIPQIINPAKCYLGLFRSDDSGMSSEDRLVDWVGVEVADDALHGFEAALLRDDLPSPEVLSVGFVEGTTWLIGYAIICGLTQRLHKKIGFGSLPADTLLSGLLLAYDGRCSGHRQDDSSLVQALEEVVLTSPASRIEIARLWIEPALDRRIDSVSGIYKLEHDDAWRETAAALVPEWLARFDDLPLNVELSLVDCLSHGPARKLLSDIARLRSFRKYPSEEQTLSWFAIDGVVRFDEIQHELPKTAIRYPNLIWYFRNRMQSQRFGTPIFSSIAQAKWVIEQFRIDWPYATMRGSSSGDENSHDATDYLRAAISRISDEIGDDAISAMQALVAAPHDSYSDLIRHMSAEQWQKRTESNYAPLTPYQLNQIFTDSTPAQIDDLKALVIEELMVAQKILIGDDLDQVQNFWNDDGIPYGENRCRDRLAAIITPELSRYGIQRITEADMPNTKRVDLAFSSGKMQLPMEVKGQWHPEVWSAATDQLDAKYLIDWKSEQRGIYCVLWFGDLPANSGRRLKVPPIGTKSPASPEEMQRVLASTIPVARRHLIDVVVLDLTAGKGR